MKRPTIEEIDAEIKLKGYDSIDSEQFFHYNEARGWKIGKQPMQKWRSCLAVWHRNAIRNTTHTYAIKQRSEAYRASKEVYTLPDKPKVANPRILELNKEMFALTGGLRGATASQRIIINKQIRSKRKEVQTLKDNEMRIKL